MQTLKRYTLILSAALLLVLSLLGSGLNQSAAYAASCTPTVFLDLWAKPGTALLYTGNQVNIWGYSLTSGDAASLPGPVLTVNQGDCVSVTLHNGLSEATSLLFQGQEMIPDTIGVAATGSKEYIFTASRPGTFLYEAGLIPGAQHQVAMGLYGALVVRPLDVNSFPLTNQAYTDISTAFDTEAVLVLSEIDPLLNNSLTPAAFDMRHYAPRYFLINGKAYPDTASIFTASGDIVLLRFVNAGLQSHAMSLLGVSQKAIAVDGSLFAHPHSMVADTIATGQTLDSLVTLSTFAVVDTKYPIYDANMMLRNTGGSSASLGGMLTFLTIGTAPPPGPDTTGPLLSSIALSPNPSVGTVPVNLSFTASDTSTGGSNVTAAEYWIDSGVHTSITAGTPAVTVDFSAVIPAGLSAGTHVVSVRAQDGLGNWSATGTISLVVDNVGPTSSSLSLIPNPSNGSVSVALSFIANDSASYNSNVTAAEYWVDSGAPQPIPVPSPAPVKTINATIAAGLSAGTHVVSVRSQDALGNWGGTATITLVIDQTGPTTSGVSASPSPNNGFQGLSTTIQAVRVTASFSDVATGGSNIATAEGFVDTVGATGTGFVFVATDGSFNSPNENGYADIPLAVVGGLSAGNHTIYVQGKDAAGNLGIPSTGTLVIQKSVYFSTFGNTNPPGVGGTADDADIYLWNGSTFTRVVDASVAPYSLPSGANVDGFDRVDATHFYMSFSANSTTVPGLGAVADEDVVFYNAGTWSMLFDGSVNGLTSNSFDLDAISYVGGTLYFSTDNTNVPPGAGAAGSGDDADIYRWNGGSSYTRVVDASTAPYSIPSAANVDGLVWIDATRFYLSFTDNTTLPGLGAVQDEDVLYFSNGTWYVYFDGTAKGLTANNQDIDAFDIP